MGFRFYKPAKSVRSWIAVLIISLAVIFTSYRMANQASFGMFFSNSKPDSVSDWENSLKNIRSDLPATGTIGYIADWDIPGSDFNQDDQDVEFILTQFALVPLLVQRGAGHPYVIGNLSNENLTKSQEIYHLSLVDSYGRGIFLFKTEK